MNRAYFENYCGYGPYDENYLFHSGIEHCVSILRRYRVPVNSVLVLGAATGKVLAHFEDAFRVRPHGCELSRWAHGRIPARYRSRIRCSDMRHYLPQLLRRGRSFDVLFTNALVYLEPQELPGYVGQCSRVAGYLHFWSSTSECYEKGDGERVTLRPRNWWSELFQSQGFAPTRSPYLWRSEQRGGLD